MGWSFRARQGAVALLLTVSLAACERPEWARGEEGGYAATEPSDDPAAPLSAEGLEPWAQAIIGKNPRMVFAGNGICVGNADVARAAPAGGPPPARVVVGWGWDVAAKAPVQRVILVDAGFRIVGGGPGGQPRRDVAKVRPEFGPSAGWRAATNRSRGAVDAYGVIGGGSGLCPLGHIQL